MNNEKENCKNKKNKMIWNSFYEALKQSIRGRLYDLTCNDVYELYFCFWEELKRFTGSSTGFTGLSEVIIFAILEELLVREEDSSPFSCEKYTNNTFFLYNSRYAIGRGLTIKINSNSSRVPDISIWKIENISDVKKYIKSNVPDYAIEIKVYNTKGGETVEESIERLEKIRNSGKTDTFKGMIIFYENPPKSAEAEFSKKSEWLYYLILKDNNEGIVKCLKNFLEGDQNVQNCWRNLSNP